METGAAMTVVEGLVLGIVQGLTEFLPVSSSGHLVLVRNVLDVGAVPLLFDVLLHVATLLVIVFHYRLKIWSLLQTAGRFVSRKSREEDTEELRFILVIIIATILTVIVALLLRKTNLDGSSTFVVSILLLITAVLLASTTIIERFIRPRGSYTIGQGIITGIAQGFGTLAGISRSGITITSSLWSGMKREQAGEYAFILSIPAVLGALVLSLAEEGVGTIHVGLLPLVVGCIAACITGIVALKLLLWMVKHAKLWYFSLYLGVVGLFGLIITV